MGERAWKNSPDSNGQDTAAAFARALKGRQARNWNGKRDLTL